MSLLTVPKILIDLGRIFANDWNQNFLAITNSLNGGTDIIEFKLIFNGVNPVLIVNQKGSNYLLRFFLNSVSKGGINNIGQIESSVTEPLILTSTTKVANLNIDKWDDLSSEDILELIGGIVTGNIICHADPVNNMHLSTKQYADSKSSGFMASNTILLFGSNPPAGWTRVNAAEDRLLKLAKAGEILGDPGGSWSLQGFNISNDALTITQLPPHSHNFTYDLVIQNFNLFFVPKILNGEIKLTGGNIVHTQDTGSGQNHSHGWNDLGTWRPKYEIWSKAEKD